MDWDALKYVLAVARHGTLAAAGRELGVDPTTVGRRIAALETGIAARLFDRMPEGYRLTEAGEIAVTQSEEMEDAAHALRDRIANSDRRVAGSVRLSGLDGFFDHLVIPALPGLLARHPELELTLVSGLETVSLSKREADVALRTHRPSEPDAVPRQIGRVAYTLYAARDRDFGAAVPVIGLAREYDRLDFTRLISAVHPSAHIALRVNNEGHILAAVRAGLGISYINCHIGDSDPGLRRFRPDDVILEPVLAVSHVGMHRAPRVRAVTDFLESLIAENADLIEGRCPRPD